MFPVGRSLLGLISALWYAGAGIWTLLEATLENSLISSSSPDNKVRASKPHPAESFSPRAPHEAGLSGLGDARKPLPRVDGEQAVTPGCPCPYLTSASPAGQRSMGTLPTAPPKALGPAWLLRERGMVLPPL